ncbi:hypothetical protein O3M35_005674 [Rhynocoris fuscipes]|uniref:Uncharacterized protein n=1 Tax=Rhynocoris fuscipes TaxID=488301 RepID=A0AAW1DJ34_9HEMI
MWFTAPENTFRMSSFRTKKWKRKYALSKNGGSTGNNEKPEKNDKKDNNASKGVPANNWEYVAFNPGITGRRSVPDSPIDEPDLAISCSNASANPKVSMQPSPGPSPPGSRPNSRPPSWLAALPHHFVIEELEENQEVYEE